MFKRYTPDDFDKHGYLKAPVGFYLILLLLLRPYIIWIMSVANRSDATVLIKSLYPNKADFFVGLITGIAALLVMLFFSLRREKTFAWLPSMWHRGLILLWLSLLADMALTLWLIKSAHFVFNPQHAAIVVALFFSGLYLTKSTRLKDFFADWPQD